MEKLVELLNEYDWTPTEWKQIWDKIYFDWLGWNSELHELIIISKYYGFIKYLVDNDKIDFDNRELKDKFMLEFERYPTFHGNTYNRDFNENGLLMLLAISENPISDLISYLK